MSEGLDHVQQAKRAVDKIRGALEQLTYAADGWYEEEADEALAALDWLEDQLGLALIEYRPRSQSARSALRMSSLSVGVYWLLGMLGVAVLVAAVMLSR